MNPASKVIALKGTAVPRPIESMSTPMCQA
jgi:hypothetical protein